MVTLQLRQLSVPPGQRVQFLDVKWQDFEAILEELGEHRAARVAYNQGILEIRMPLPEHEFALSPWVAENLQNKSGTDSACSNHCQTEGRTQFSLPGFLVSRVSRYQVFFSLPGSTW